MDDTEPDDTPMGDTADDSQADSGGGSDVGRITADLDHDDVAELLGAYALDAVDPDEERAVRLHVAGCPRCRGELDDHLAVVGLLADTGGAAPSGLWDRIEADLDEGGASASPDVPRPPTPLAQGSRPRRWGTLVPVLASAAAVVAIALLGVTAINQQQRVDDLTAEVAAADRGNDVAELLATPGTEVVTLDSVDGDESVPAVVHTETTSFLIGDQLPAVDVASTYQLWGRTADGVVSLGLLGRDPETVGFRADAQTVALMITKEKAGGAAQPTELARLQATIPGTTSS